MNGPSTKPVLTLKQFILKQQVKSLYRRILRTAKLVPDEAGRTELRNWARDEFRTNAHHTEEEAIKMLISYGERSLKELRTSIYMAKG